MQLTQGGRGRWETRVRHLCGGSLIVIACISVASCLTIPQSYKEVTGDIGVQANVMHRFAGFEFLTTVAFVKGKTAAKTYPRHRVDCVDGGISASVLWSDPLISKGDARRACGWVLQAVSYVAAYARDPRVASVRYRLFLVPQGQTAEMRSFSLRPPGRLRPLYLAHWHQDTQRAEAIIVGTLAHEALHLDMFVLGLHDPLPEDEDYANLAGACARLAVMGRIDSRNYQNGVPRKPADFQDTKLNPSMYSAGEFSVKIAPLFNRDGLILADSKNGRALSKHCDDELTKLFQKAAK